MIINFIGGLIFIATSFIIRYLAEKSTMANIITWSMLGFGLLICIYILHFLFKKELKGGDRK